MNRYRNFLNQEASVFHVRLKIVQLLLAPLPPYLFGALRAQLLRAAGFGIGAHSAVWGIPSIVGNDNIYKKLIIGSGCLIGIQAYFDLADCIILEDNVGVGPQVTMITGTHELGTEDRRYGDLTSKPIRIGRGVWIGARSTILPGVTIGKGVVVAAGAVVTKDVEPNTLVAGVPAVLKRKLDPQPAMIDELNRRGSKDNRQ